MALTQVREIVKNETGGCPSTHGASGYTMGDAWNDDFTAIICILCGGVIRSPFATGQVYIQPKGFRAWLRGECGQWHDLWPSWIEGETKRRQTLGLFRDA